MAPLKLKKIARNLKRWLDPNWDYLGKVDGVVHVGANTGQERDLYRKNNVTVAWIEPIPEVFAELAANISGYPNQSAVQALIADVEGQPFTLKISNNHGASSSILDLKLHKKLWPDVHFVREIEIKGTTLAALIESGAVKMLPRMALVMDTQGAELKVLNGAGDHLRKFSYVCSEAADFEAYEGCATVDSLASFLDARGFSETTRSRMRNAAGVGSYYNILYKQDVA